MRRWKDGLPDAGGWFGDGSKQRIEPANRDGLARLAAETRRAEWVHWANVAFGATFFLWTPWPIGLVMTGFAVLAHGPFILVQRFNRARIDSVGGVDRKPTWA